jgi:hypothetical protein
VPPVGTLGGVRAGNRQNPRAEKIPITRRRIEARSVHLKSLTSTAHPRAEMRANAGHPISPEKLALAVDAGANAFSDHNNALA